MEAKTVNLSNLKKGDWFKFKGKKKVYVFDGGGKKRGFNYTALDDIADFKSTKTNREIETDFEV